MRRACFERVAGKRTAPPRFLMLKSMICQLWRSLSHCPTLVFTAAPLRRAALRGHGGERESERGRERAREREGGGGGGGSQCQESSHTHSFSYLHATCLHVKKKRKKKRKKSGKRVDLRAAACVFFFFLFFSQSLVLTAEGNLPAPHPAPRTPERNMKPHSPAAHQVLSQTHTQAES